MSEIKSCINSQKEYFATHITKDLHFREVQLKKLRKLIANNESEIFQALQKDLSKPQTEAYGTEIGFTLHDIDYVLSNIKKWAKPKSVTTNILNQPGKSTIYYEPYGVNLIISPWNYPFQLAMVPAVAAIAAGNTVIIKPSELSEATSEIMKKIINENFPKEFMHVFTGGVETAQELLAERFDKIFFTGSTQVGKIIAKAAAENLTPVTLELGGKSPGFVLDDCNFEVTAKRLLWGKLMNAGQTCVAPDFLYVSENSKDKLVCALKAAHKKFFPDGVKPGENLSTIIGQRHYERLKGFLTEGDIIFGGNYDDSKKFLEPTLLDNVSWDSLVMQEEIFGPVWPLMTYKTEEEAISKLQEGEKPLAFYVFTDSSSKEERILKEISFGGGCINETLMQLGNPNLPFGGVGHSGYGTYHGEIGFQEFSHMKSVLKKPTWIDLDLRYPPYNESKFSWLRKLLG